MSFIKNVFKKIGNAILDLISAAALIIGITEIVSTTAAVANLDILEAANLAVSTYIFMSIGKRSGLKLVDFILEKSGMVEHSRSRPDGEFLKVYKTKSIKSDPEDYPSMAFGVSLDSNWQIGPFNISFPWAGYSNKFPLGAKEFINYARVGLNYLFTKSGLEARCNYIARTQDNIDIEMNLLIGAKDSKGDLEVIQSIKDNEKKKNIELVNTALDKSSKITQQLKYNECVEIEQLNSDPIWNQVSKKMTTVANQIKYAQDQPRIAEILSKTNKQHEVRKQEENAARERVLRWNMVYKPHENTANEPQSETTEGEVQEVGTRMDYEPRTTKKRKTGGRKNPLVFKP